MAFTHRLLAGLRALLWKESAENELSEEVQAYLESAADEKVRSGMSPAEALRAARLEAGHPEVVKEAVRDVGWESWLESLFADLRFGARMLVKNPTFALVAVLTLALGIGANTAIFSAVYAVLLKPLPYPGADRLVMVWEDVRTPHYVNDRNAPAPGNFAAWRSASLFEEMAAIRSASFAITGGGEPQRVEGEGVSGSFFRELRVNATIGRLFVDAEDRPGSHLVVISYDLWVSRYGSDPALVGRTIPLDGVAHTVLGVMPAGFNFPDPDDQLWVPLGLTPSELENHGSHYLRVMGRLKPGVGIDQARGQMAGLARDLTRRFPDSNTGVGANLVPLQEEIVGDTRPVLLILVGAVGLVLVIVCANVANLMLARASTRQREIAIRVALGARRNRILRQLLTESMSLSLLGGSAGVLLAYWGVSTFRAALPSWLPRVSEITLSGTVLGFSCGVSLLAGLFFGAVPALQARRTSLQGAWREGVRETTRSSRLRARNLLVIVETALGVVVIVGAGLLLRSFLRLQHVPLGFQTDGLLTLRVIPRGENYATPAARLIFYQQVQQRMEAIPGVRSAAAVTFIPLTRARGSKGFEVEGQPPPRPGEEPMAQYEVSSPGYFHTMGTPILAGRDFSWSDTPATLPIAIINRTMARTFWPDEDALGKRFRLGGSEAPWLMVAGIVADVRQFDVPTPAGPTMYLPVTQFSAIQPRDAVLRDWVIRTAGIPSSVAGGVRNAIWSVDRDLPISRVRTMEQVRSSSTAPERFNLVLFGIFAGLALALATVGLYGVVAYSIAQRTREIGIRMALGAQPRNILKMVLGEGARLTFVGVAVGIATALGLGRLMAEMLYQMSPADPLTYGAVALLLVAVGLGACYVPARRAMRMEAAATLRQE